MKFSIRKAQVTVGEKTFTDETNLELSWTHGDKGCMFVVKSNIGWKALCKYARDGRTAFKKHLGV